MEPINKTMKNTREKSEGSLKKKIPMSTVPTAPIPVHTAYPVPIGIVWIALFKSKKLTDMLIKKPIDQILLVKF